MPFVALGLALYALAYAACCVGILLIPSMGRSEFLRCSGVEAGLWTWPLALLVSAVLAVVHLRRGVGRRRTCAAALALDALSVAGGIVFLTSVAALGSLLKSL